MVKRDIIQIDRSLCTGCGNCVTACVEGAIEMRDGKAEIVSERYCDGLGACIGECPAGALRIVEKDVDEFDEEAVHQHLAKVECESIPIAGCPGSGPRRFEAKGRKEAGEVGSQLTTWPIQIRLVPVKAPYLNKARLLIAADCTAFACGKVHSDFIKDRVVLIGCPKLDDNDEIVKKLTVFFSSNDIQEVTLLHMEVPCCRAYARLIKQAIANSGKNIPYKQDMVMVEGGEVREIA